MINYKYRPEIDLELVEKLLKLTNQIGFSPNRCVNLLVKIGIEVIEKSADKLETDLKIKLENLLKDFNLSSNDNANNNKKK